MEKDRRGTPMSELNVAHSNDAVVLDMSDDVAVLRLNRPASRNALSQEIKKGFEALLPRLMKDAAVRCIVITGTDKSFCAGGDISNMAERAAPAVLRRMHHTHTWSKQILTGNKPVIAAVNGAAAGAGFSLALLCDVVIVSQDAFFRPAFSGLGAVPDLGLAMTLPRSIGASRAKEILLSNRRIDAAEAVSVGIATRAVAADALLEEAMMLARNLAAGPATALGLTKMLVNNAYEPIDNFHDTEAMAQAVAFGSSEFAEGVAAFLAKRKPDFRRSS
jgi:2-(1,2-epoxy-1,2-dihydrophenyl)acetyl-CoA isomerase